MITTHNPLLLSVYVGIKLRISVSFLLETHLYSGFLGSFFVPSFLSSFYLLRIFNMPTYTIGNLSYFQELLYFQSFDLTTKIASNLTETLHFSKNSISYSTIKNVLLVFFLHRFQPPDISHSSSLFSPAIPNRSAHSPPSFS